MRLGSPAHGIVTKTVHRTVLGAVRVKGIGKWVFRSSGESKGLGSLGDGGLAIVEV